MPGNFRNEDLRVIRTYNALGAAMPKTLERKNFAQITVNDLCEEAQLSRAAFYARFSDKYDLLKYCLTNIRAEIISMNRDYDSLADTLNKYIYNYRRQLTNLLEGANDEVEEIMHWFLFSLFQIPEERDKNGKLTPKYLVLSNFCAGGMYKLLTWQIKHRFPAGLQTINIYFYDIMKPLLDFKDQQIKIGGTVKHEELFVGQIARIEKSGSKQ